MSSVCVCLCGGGRRYLADARDYLAKTRRCSRAPKKQFNLDRVIHSFVRSFIHSFSSSFRWTGNHASSSMELVITTEVVVVALLFRIASKQHIKSLTIGSQADQKLLTDKEGTKKTSNHRLVIIGSYGFVVMSCQWHIICQVLIVALIFMLARPSSRWNWIHTKPIKTLTLSPRVYSWSWVLGDFILRGWWDSTPNEPS